jgi:DNA polymerase alpha subunit A
MRGKKAKEDEIERLKHAREHNVSGIALIEQKRAQEEAAEKRRSKKQKDHDEDDDFVDDAINEEVDPKIAKQLQKIKHAPAEENFDQDEPVNATGALLNAISKMKPATAKPKKIDEKANLASENLMNDLFSELDNQPAPVARAAQRPAIIQHETNTNAYNPNRMDEELPVQNSGAVGPSFDDELEELESRMNHMDVEAPTTAAPVRPNNQVPAQRPSISAARPASDIAMNDKDVSTLVRNLYTRKKESQMEFFRNLQNEGTDQSSRAPPMLSNGKLLFYWMDIQEEYRKKSLVHLYGKVKLENGKSASACLTVENMQRNYYFIKRVNENVKLADVENEVSQKIQKRHPQIFKDIKLKQVTDKHYAFELDIARGQVEAIEVTYSFDHAPLEIPFEGDSYKGLIGKTYKTTELFVINNKLMGPCWLEVENFTKMDNKDYSTCEYEFRVKSIYDVETAESKEAGDPPRCKLMSVSLVKDKEGGNEIKAITALYNDNYDIENVQSELKLVPVVFMQVKADRTAMYKDTLKRCFGENIFCFPNEFALMNAFVMFFNKRDPDLIVGHDINNMFFEPFISRAERTNQLGLLSRLSRSNRDATEMRRAIKTFGLKKIRAVTYGRMVCDTLLCSQEHIRETNYELDYLAEKHLNESNLCEYRAASSNELRMNMQLIDENMMNAHLSLGLSQKLQLVQLNKQLTNVAGCFWYQSFQNMRAERNEMLLMHTFYRNQYLFPDKYVTKWDESKKGKKREKAKYEGGLVLEPKSGLYQDIILLLDFNSLYPSIIREYKICFTTVNRDYVEIDFYEPDDKKGKHPNLNDDDDEDGEAEEDLNKLAATTRIPDHDAQSITETKLNQILPKIVQKLIQKRKEVKAQAKSAKSELEKDTLDIKQKAYKLIANSIYGCLGFKNSRFYSKQMAALITYYGRNTLQKTAQKVAEMQYDVIYGDTDSLMINSKQKDLVNAIEEGFKIKKVINKNNSILEIDVDGIFRSLLLLKKKKYAADKLQNLDDVKKTMRPTDAKFGIELKGLDIVRRDWSGLTKMCGDYLVHQILNIQLDIEDIYTNIFNYFTNFMLDLKAGRINLDAFIIYKQLTKNLSEYNDKGQPHVVVAKKMKNHMGYTNEQLVNHFIPYIICEPKGNNVGLSFSERAYHPDEVKSLGLKPDIKWYTNNQLLNPVIRLVDYLPGFNQERLGQILEIEKEKLNSASENKIDATYVHEEGASVLYAADEFGGTTVEWKCSDGHSNTFKAGENSLQCTMKQANGTHCSKSIALGTLKNLAIQATRAQMMEYNSTVFAFQRKLGDQPVSSGSLPITEIEFSTEQEQALADAVTRVNTKLNNLDKLFETKQITEPELKSCFEQCKKGISTLREQSQYSKVNFGAMCSKISTNRNTCKHYALVGTSRPRLVVS